MKKIKGRQASKDNEYVIAHPQGVSMGMIKPKGLAAKKMPRPGAKNGKKKG